MTIAERIKKARAGRDLTQRDLAEAVGVSPQAVQQWEKGETSPRGHRLEKLGAALGVSPQWITHGTGAGPDDGVIVEPVPLPPLSRIPIVGTTQAGPDAHWEELGYPPGWGEEYVDMPSYDPNSYALRVKGASMGSRIREGDAIVVSPNSEPQPGEEVVVKTLDGQVMVKELAFFRRGEIGLDSVGEGFGRILLKESEVAFIHSVVGIVLPSLIKHR